MVLWIIYLIWWIIGTDVGLVPLGIETLGFMILDVTAKVGFELILLRSPSVLSEVGSVAVEAMA